jgi:serine phosphatase RsbU (regulator of sigma subunit)
MFPQSYTDSTKREEEILSSVKYASLIQKSLFPKERHFRRISPDYGLIFLPHSILSGDFYWIGNKEEENFIAVADCTGHGIPASLLSVMGIGLLNYIVFGKTYRECGMYLEELDKKWIEGFQDEHNLPFNNDWMEISLLKISKERLEIASARQKVILFNSITSEVKIIKGERYPIGGWQLEKNRRFGTICIDKNQYNEVYLFTDGLADQFGGESSKKLGLKTIIEIIRSSFHSVSEKISFLEDFVLNWKKNHAQTDDITMIGFALQ